MDLFEDLQRSQPKFLISGASGSTGRSAVETLVRQGHVVRALVRTEDEHATTLRRAGAEVVVAGLLDLDAVRASLDGVGAIVNMSRVSARRGSKTAAMIAMTQRRQLSQQIFRGSPAGCVPVD